MWIERHDLANTAYVFISARMGTIKTKDDERKCVSGLYSIFEIFRLIKRDLHGKLVLCINSPFPQSI